MMDRKEIETHLAEVRDARGVWATRVTEFYSGVDAIMSRLLHEAAVNFMSPEDVSRVAGLTPTRVRKMMRDAGLNPKEGKRMLSQKAAEALANNAALLGVEPAEMDLMSPLAYLPMGEQMRRDLAAKAVEQANAEDWQAMCAAVLKIHQPVGKDPYCRGCWEAGGMDGAPSWPCETAEALGVTA